MDETGSVEFEPWYRREYPKVLTALVLVTGDGDRAREAADEAFARALARREPARRQALRATPP
jgi:predicted RNA polymerase sigma factor